MYVGIDVAKASLEVRGATWKASENYKNNSNGIKKIVVRLSQEECGLVVMEATAGYERKIAKALQEANIPLAVVNPWQTHNFGKSLGLRAKTDPIDAGMLCRFAEAIRPETTKVLNDQEWELHQLMMRRIQLMGQKTQERNRLEHATGSIRKSIYAIIKVLRSQIKSITGQIEKRIEGNTTWKEKAEILKSAKGVGDIVAFTLCALLPELGVLNRKQIGALVGVVPYNGDSGNGSKQRNIAGGRAEVRSMLYMATLSATRSNTKIKNFYKKLLARGKKKKVALVACMRKFLVCLNAMCKTGKPWKNSTK